MIEVEPNEPNSSYPGIDYGEVEPTPWYVPLLLDMSDYRRRYYELERENRTLANDAAVLRMNLAHSGRGHTYKTKLHEAHVKNSNATRNVLLELANSMSLSDPEDMFTDDLAKAIADSMAKIDDSLAGVFEEKDRQIAQLRGDCNALRAQLQAQGIDSPPSTLSVDDLAKVIAAGPGKIFFVEVGEEGVERGPRGDETEGHIGGAAWGGLSPEAGQA